MGLRGFGSLLVVFLIVMVVFGTHRLRDIGGDLAVAIRNFRKGLEDKTDHSDDEKTSS